MNINKSDKLLISIVGNIAVGKSTFCKVLQKLHSDIGIYIENICGYTELVEAYYRNPEVYTAPFQIFMLNRKLINISDAMKSPYIINVIERGLEDNRSIFAAHRHETGCSSDRAWEEYTKFYNMIKPIVPEPNIYIYLTGDSQFLFNRIQNQRKRPGEEMITLKYLEDINDRYELWIEKKIMESCYVYRINIDKDLKEEEINIHFWNAVKMFYSKNIQFIKKWLL